MQPFPVDPGLAEKIAEDVVQIGRKDFLRPEVKRVSFVFERVRLVEVLAGRLRGKFRFVAHGVADQHGGVQNVVVAFHPPELVCFAGFLFFALWFRLGLKQRGLVVFIVRRVVLLANAGLFRANCVQFTAFSFLVCCTTSIHKLRPAGLLQNAFRARLLRRPGALQGRLGNTARRRS